MKGISALCLDSNNQIDALSTSAQDEELLKSVLAFYRLMAAWMLRMASPAAAAGEQPQLPLPTPAPQHFRMLPVRTQAKSHSTAHAL